MIACVSVNDAFVMKAWGQAQNVGDIRMLADGDGSFSKALGLELDTGGFGGLRSCRYAMIIRDGAVDKLNVEQGTDFDVSKAETILSQL